MLHLVFRDRALVRAADTWLPTTADRYDPKARVTFATIMTLVDMAGGRREEGTTLTEAGAELFFGPCRQSTPLDDPVVR